jgi:hypothetical protein
MAEKCAALSWRVPTLQAIEENFDVDESRKATTNGQIARLLPTNINTQEKTKENLTKDS